MTPIGRVFSGLAVIGNVYTMSIALPVVWAVEPIAAILVFLALALLLLEHAPEALFGRSIA